MCDKPSEPAEVPNHDQTASNNVLSDPKDSHIVHELKQKLEYHIRKIGDIQKAIDAVNNIS
jgi:hypothetical protein